MKIKVRYLSEDEIERDAEQLLAEYEETAGAPTKLPVPVEDLPPITWRSGSGLPTCTRRWEFRCCVSSPTFSARSGWKRKRS